VTLFIDTSVWSLAFRRDVVPDIPEVKKLATALAEGATVITTGLVLQELLQGFSGPKQQADIINHFAAIPLISPSRADHIAAAELRNTCRRTGVQVGTIDAIIAQICIANDLDLLTTDGDFTNMAQHCGLRVWSGK
jgi:predicted nucleic acid-binding protein